jgi:hypothetical protein
LGPGINVSGFSTNRFLFNFESKLDVCSDDTTLKGRGRREGEEGGGRREERGERREERGERREERGER